MKRIVMIIILFGMMLGLVFAAEALSPEDERFLSDLAFQLRTRGWDETELGPLMEQARLMRWDEGRAADPAVVAFALHHGSYDWEEEGERRGLIRAQLALQLAISTQLMERLGYGAQAIAQGAAKGVAEAVNQLRTQSMPQTNEELGIQVRSMVRSTVANEIALQQKHANRAALGTRQQAPMNVGQGAFGFGNRPATPGGGLR